MHWFYSYVKIVQKVLKVVNHLERRENGEGRKELSQLNLDDTNATRVGH